MVVQYHRTRVQHTPQFHIITIPRTIRYQLHLIMPHRVSPTDQGTPVLHHIPRYGSTPSNASRSTGNNTADHEILGELAHAHQAHVNPEAQHHHEPHEAGLIPHGHGHTHTSVPQSNGHTGVHGAPSGSQQPLGAESNAASQTSEERQASLMATLRNSLDDTEGRDADRRIVNRGRPR